MKRISKEYMLFGGFVVSLSVLVLLIAHLPVPSWLNGHAVSYYLVDDQVKNVASGFALGYLAAYFFYLVNEYFPRKKLKHDALAVSECLLASILHAYEKSQPFGHEIPIDVVSKNMLDVSELANEISKLRQTHSQLGKDDKKILIAQKWLPIKFAIETAGTRLSEFRSVVPMIANTFSPQHVLQWLVIIDKVRLLAKQEPVLASLRDRLTKNETELSKSYSLRQLDNIQQCDSMQRLYEYMEAVKNWLLIDSQR